MTEAANALTEQYRRIFRMNEPDSDEGRFAKASAWYSASFGQKFKLRPHLSFGWIMADVLCQVWTL
jgi:hypothetical protein